MDKEDNILEEAITGEIELEETKPKEILTDETPEDLEHDTFVAEQSTPDEVIEVEW